jgi:hypothetical protein
MTAERPPRLTVTVKTRPGQVLNLELGPDDAAEVNEALILMVTALFGLERPELVRTVTFDIERATGEAGRLGG